MFIDSEWNSATSVYEGPKKSDTILNRNLRMASSYIELRVWYDRYKRYTVYEIRYRILYILFVLQSRQKKKSSIIVNYSRTNARSTVVNRYIYIPCLLLKVIKMFCITCFITSSPFHVCIKTGRVHYNRFQVCVCVCVSLGGVKRYRFKSRA